MGRINKTLEKDEVLIPCIKLCKRLKGMGYIIKWRRLDALDYYHEPGDPDLEIWFIKDNTLWILMAECKAPKGKLRPSQVEYRDKYKYFKNVIYLEIRDVEELKKSIMNIADNINFNPSSFKEMSEYEIT